MFIQWLHPFVGTPHTPDSPGVDLGCILHFTSDSKGSKPKHIFITGPKSNDVTSDFAREAP